MLTSKVPERLITDTLGGVPSGGVDSETGGPLTLALMWELMGFDVKWSDSIVPRAYTATCKSCGEHIGSAVEAKKVRDLLNAHSDNCTSEHWSGMDAT